MAILKIARMGHPVLMGVADPVADPTDPAIHALVADMVETMVDADGIGLAAPQVHIPLRIVVFHVPGPRLAAEDDEKGVAAVGLTVLVNPVIEVLGDETVDGFEGCLSLPGMRGRVRRAHHICYRAVGLDGEPIEREAMGFHARVVQHECDHLDGVLYPMRMTDLGTLGYTEEQARGEADTDEAETP